MLSTPIPTSDRVNTLATDYRACDGADDEADSGAPKIQHLATVGLGKISERCLRYAHRACEQDFSIMIYFAGLKPEWLDDLVDDEDDALSSWRLHQAFTGQIQKQLQAVAQHAQPLKEGDERLEELQPGQQLFFAQLPVRLSALLLDRMGCINSGLIPLLESALRTELGVCEEQARWETLLSGLRKLHTDSALREAIEAIEAPCHPNMELVVRTCLALPAKAPLSTGKLRAAALSGLLYRLHQGRSGSCFATSVCRAVMASDPMRCVQDFTQLLKEGQLTRSVAGEQLDFPVVLQVPKAHADRIRDVSSPAQIKRSFGLRAAARVLGLDWAKVLKLPLGRQSVERLLARAAGARNCNALLFAFEAQTSHALLKVWDGCVASMAEAEAHGVVTRRLLGSLQHGWLAQTATVLQHCEELEEQVHRSLREAVLARRQYRYYPAMSNGKVGEDGRSSAAAFVLFDRKSAEQITGPASYCQFLSRCLEDARGQLVDDEQHFLRAALDELERQLRLPGAAERLARNYPYADRGQRPWCDYASNSPRAILKVYLEMPQLPGRMTLRPKRAEALLGHIIDWLKACPEESKLRLREHPELLVPVSTAGQHAFCLRPGAPSLRQAWSAQYPAYTQTWIQHKLIDPGRQLARQPVPLPLREAFADQLDPSSLPAGINFPDYRDRLLEASADPHLSEQRLHNQLLAALPVELRRELLSRAVVIADSNWRSGIAALALAFVFNPFSDRLELWELDDAGGARALDQDFWLLKRHWLLYTDGLGFFA